MRGVRMSEDFVPVSEFKARTAVWLKRVLETNAPVVVTQNGKPAGVLLSPQAFDELIEQARFVTAVMEGVPHEDAERVHAYADLARRMKAPPRR